MGHKMSVSGNDNNYNYTVRYNNSIVHFSDLSNPWMQNYFQKKTRKTKLRGHIKKACFKSHHKTTK